MERIVLVVEVRAVLMIGVRYEESLSDLGHGGFSLCNRCCRGSACTSDLYFRLRRSIARAREPLAKSAGYS
jgi:hypothetical protein